MGIFPFTISRASIHNIEDVAQEVGIGEKYNSKVEANIKFKDEHDQPFFLNKVFTGTKPVVITPVYFTCPLLCSYLLRGFISAINKEDKFKIGQNFDVLSVSMNHRETSKNAQKIKKAYISQLNYEKPEKELAAQHWHFLRGSEQDLKTFFNSVGFYYKKDGQEFAHTAAIILLTPDGKVSRYLFGILFPEKDFRLSLIEAGRGKVGSVIDKLVLYCFHFDPAKRHYGLIAMNVMRIGGSIGAVIMFSILGVYFFRTHKKNNNKIKGKIT